MDPQTSREQALARMRRRRRTLADARQRFAALPDRRKTELLAGIAAAEAEAQAILFRARMRRQ